MARVVQTDQARADLREILRYLRGHSRPAAERFAKAVKERLSLLAKSPGLGRERLEFGAGVRSLVVGDYIVVYQVAEKVVTVLRLFHGSRDIDTLMNLTDWRPPDSTSE